MLVVWMKHLFKICEAFASEFQEILVNRGYYYNVFNYFNTGNAIYRD